MIPPHYLRIIAYYAVKEGAKLAKKGAEMAKEAYDDYQYRQPRSLVIIGPKGSGKTTLYAALGAKVKMSPTTLEYYDSFSFKTSKGTVNISFGRDYGGDLENKETVQRYWRHIKTPTDDKLSVSDVICGKDSIIFLFDIYRYIVEDNYTDAVNRRLAAIINYLSKHSMSHKLFVYATCAGNLAVSHEIARQQVKQKSKNTLCEMELGDSLQIVDLHDSESINIIKEEVFKYPK